MRAYLAALLTLFLSKINALSLRDFSRSVLRVRILKVLTIWDNEIHEKIDLKEWDELFKAYVTSSFRERNSEVIFQ